MMACKAVWRFSPAAALAVDRIWLPGFKGLTLSWRAKRVCWMHFWRLLLQVATTLRAGLRPVETKDFELSPRPAPSMPLQGCWLFSGPAQHTTLEPNAIILMLQLRQSFSTAACTHFWIEFPWKLMASFVACIANCNFINKFATSFQPN